ncbi:MAG: hypothetical protein JSS51_10420, partial [Planctomycetes bacterium]|nr:hypothetical protein [Planctomycetota bacterium]
MASPTSPTPPTSPTTPPTLYLIDGYAQFFRAYHAIRTPMTSPVTKEPTNMTFGFVGMLLKLLRGEGKLGGRPEYVAVALDISGDKETFRSELYPEYKATRSDPPQDLFPQVERCLALMKEIGIPTVGIEGFEADDAIASVVTQLRKLRPELRIRIISKDKDLKQLLCAATGECGGVELFDVHTDLVIDEAHWFAESGLKPAQVIDYLALMGDTVDNVPGVEGVGEKTSAALIAEFGSLDALIAKADTIKGKRGEKIREAIPKLGLSRQLVTLRHDAPVELPLASADAAKFKLDRLIPILKELGFNRYQDDVRALMLARGEALPAGLAAPMPPDLPRPDPAQPKPAPRAARNDFIEGGLFASLEPPKVIANPGGDYRCVKTRAELDDLITELRRAPVIAVDTETTSVSPMRAQLCGISLSTRIGTGAYIPVRSPDCGSHLDEQTVLDALRPVLEDP